MKIFSNRTKRIYQTISLKQFKLIRKQRKANQCEKYLHKKQLGELYTGGHCVHAAFGLRWIIMPAELYSAHTIPANINNIMR